MPQGDPWAGFEKKPEGDPWAGFESSTATMEPGRVYPDEPPEQSIGQRLYGLIEAGVRGAEMGTGAAIDWIGSTGERALNLVFPGNLTQAEMRRREKRAGQAGRDLTAYAEKEHPAPRNLGEKIAEGVGGVVPYAATEVLSGGTATVPIVATIFGQNASRRYQEALAASGGDETKANMAMLEGLPADAAMVAPFVGVFGRIAGRNPAAGNLIKEALKQTASGVVGMGAARTLGDAVHEQVTGEDREILKNAMEGAVVDTALFAFLAGVAGVREKSASKGTPRPTPTEPIERGEAAREASQPVEPAPSVPKEAVPGEGLPSVELPGETALLPREPTASEVSGALGEASHAAIEKRAREIHGRRIEPVEGYTPKGELPPKAPRPSLQVAAQDPTLREAAQEYGKASERRKLDIREQLQDNLREFLTPEDIEAIATFEGPVQDVKLPDVYPEQPRAAQASGEAGGPRVIAEPGTASDVPLSPEHPAEPRLISELPTSAKNAITEQERAMRGESPLEQAASREWAESWEMSRDAMEQDPSLAYRLIRGEGAAGTSSDVRQSVLVREKIPTDAEYEKVSNALLREQRAGNEEAAAALSDQKEALRSKLDAIDAALRKEGTEHGRGLSIRRMMVNRDFSLAAVEREFRIAKGGEELTEAEAAKAKDVSERIRFLEGEVERIEANLFHKAVNSSPQRKGRLLEFTSAQAEAARARIKARGTRAMAGLDPVDLADRVIVGVDYLAKDISELVAWSKAMVQEFGEAIRPHLEEIYAKAKEQFETAARRAGSERAAITRMRGTAEKLRGKIEQQDFEPEPKREPLPMTPERLKAKAELEEVRREYNAALAEFRFKNRTTGQKVIDRARESVNFWKQLKTAYDVSAVFRQGGWGSFSRPIKSAVAAKRMFEALKDPRRALEIDTEIRNRPNFEAGQKAGLELTNLDGPLSAREEHMRSEWAKKVPLVGQGVEASNRAFTTFLNVQRASIFDALADVHPDYTPKELNAIANYVNVSTGRGFIGKGRFANVARAAADVLWSPRLLISRFQLLLGQPMYRGTARTRIAIAKEYGRAAVRLAAFYAAARMYGAEIGDDPRSADAGKIIIGNTRIDPLMGLAQVGVLLSRAGRQAYGRLAGEKKPPAVLDKYGKGHPFGFEDIARFGRNKLTPELGVVADALTGTNTVGEPVTAESMAQDLVPLAWQDVLKVMKEHGVEEGAAIQILGLLGMGVQNYETKKK